MVSPQWSRFAKWLFNPDCSYDHLPSWICGSCLRLKNLSNKVETSLRIFLSENSPPLTCYVHNIDALHGSRVHVPLLANVFYPRISRITMVCAVVRQTFRVHDNLVLTAALVEDSTANVVWAVDRETIPDYASDGDRTVGSSQFSYHMWHLMLCVVRQHFKDLSKRGLATSIAIRESGTDWAQQLGGLGDIHFDQHADPAFDEMTAALRSLGAKEHATRSMVDWTSNDAGEVVRANFKKPFSKLSKLKAACDGLRRSMADPLPAIKTHVDQMDRSWEAWVDSEIERVRNVSQAVGRTLFDFDAFWSIHDDQQHCDFDERVMRFSQKAASLIADPQWKKQATARDLRWGWFVEGKTLQNCSQASPWIATGCLSPLHFCADIEALQVRLGTPKKMLGSGVDQLRFREAYYAIAYADKDRDAFWSDKKGKWWGKSTAKYRYEPETPYNPALRWKDTGTIWQWATGTEPNKEKFDVSRAAVELRDVGWVHHLKRHMLVDHLCNGGLRAHWLFAERWFAAVEADYDAVSNRANAMWLAAVAFSTKQRAKSHFHYSPKNYISKQHTSRDRIRSGPIICV